MQCTWEVYKDLSFGEIKGGFLEEGVSKMKLNVSLGVEEDG